MTQDIFSMLATMKKRMMKKRTQKLLKLLGDKEKPYNHETCKLKMIGQL